MKLYTLILMTLFAIHSFATQSEPDCAKVGSNELICTYAGSTGLELFGELSLAQIQRLPVVIQKHWGSIVLIQKASLNEKVFEECWSTSHNLPLRLLIFCTNQESPNGDAPEPIWREIEYLKGYNI